MLDGIHMDKRRYDVLPANVQFQQANFRSRRFHMHAGLGKHGRLHDNPGDTRARTIGHNDSLHLLLHLLDDEKIAIRCAHTRQGIRHCPIRKSEQSESHYVLRPGAGVLAVLGTVRRPQNMVLR